jgi:hypothetical protein
MALSDRNGKRFPCTVACKRGRYYDRGGRHLQAHGSGICQIPKNGKRRTIKLPPAWPPIIAQAWLNSLERRTEEDSPVLKSYWISRYILTEMFGEKWVRDFVCPSKFDSFFRNNADNDKDGAVHLVRVVHLVEMLYNSQWITGYAPCIKQLKTFSQIESTYAELDVARLMIATNVQFIFNERKLKQRSDHDLLITFPTGLEVCGETKCKIEATTQSEGTIIRSLEHARDKNLPDDWPGIVFAKVPYDWIKDEPGREVVGRAATQFLEASPSIVSVKFLASTVLGDGIETREALSWIEYGNPDNRFDPEGDWRLFPTTWESSSDWNGMPPHWKRILRGDWI